MVLGCSSGAGKTWLATALCRWYARQGLRVAPFKAQNMSNHARVVIGPGGMPGEIGSAQYFQALAAGAVPDVRMNPVLLKPEADTRSQVVVLGQVRAELADIPWRERSPLLWREAAEAYRSLAMDYDLIVIEGAGSPAEINLAADDYVNTSTARLAGAACLLVSDIDRGGAFAHLYGTHRLMDAEVRGQVRGFVLNRFRGDPALLAPGPADLEALTGVPTVAVIPMVADHGLPEEDAVPASTLRAVGLHVVVLATPSASNLDEFEPLRRAGVRLSFTRDAATVAAADWLVLPGSKQVRRDLAWLRSTGLDAAVLAHAATGRPLIGICGGLQLLGERLDDPHALEAAEPGADQGLGVLQVTTRYTDAKRLAQVSARFGALVAPWQALSGLCVDGYEIHLGRTSGPRPVVTAADDATRALGWQQAGVLGLYVHGLFESPAVIQALFGVSMPTLEQSFERLADVVETEFSRDFLRGIVCGERH